MTALFTLCVNQAFTQAKALLWPVRSRLWFKLIFLYALTGGCQSFPGNIPNFSGIQNAFQEKSTTPVVSSSATSSSSLRSMDGITTWAMTIWRENKKLIFTLVGLLGGIGILLLLVFMWLTSRLQLVLTKSLVVQDFQLRHHWRGTRELGESFFRFNAFLFFLLLIITAGLGGGLWLLSAHFGFQKVWWTIPLSALGFFFILIPSAFAAWIMGRFLPVFMVLTEQTLWPSLKNIVHWCRETAWTSVGALGLYMLLSLGVSMVVGMIFIFLGLLAIPLLVVGGIAVAFLKSLVGTLVLVTIFGTAAIVVVSLLVLVINVPIQTFFSYLRIEIIRQFMGVKEPTEIIP
jgi:hypothetical protein